MEDDAGGSSQDRYESDFINDDGREEIEATKARRLKKGQIDSSDEEEFMVKSERNSTKKTQSGAHAKQVIHDEVEESEENQDPYDRLVLSQGQEAGGFKHNPEENEYCLPDFFSLPAKIYERLFEHQKKGVIWLYNLYRNRRGGVLGDDMGLGKTVQVATLCKGLFNSEQISKVLVVVPATMKMYWQGELQKWCPGVENVMQFDDKKKSNREQ